MIERITEMPAGTVGFRVAGDVEREDYRDVLVPELRRALDAGGGLRTLYLIEDLDEIEPGRCGPTPSSASISASATTAAGRAQRSSPTWNGWPAQPDCSHG